jgi:hypothetical protein
MKNLDLKVAQSLPMKMDSLKMEDIKESQTTVNSITTTPLLSDRDDDKSKQD